MFKIKISSSVGVEKENYKKLLELHLTDASREYIREEGN